jgi:hypothetical protein
MFEKELNQSLIRLVFISRKSETFTLLSPNLGVDIVTRKLEGFSNTLSNGIPQEKPCHGVS